VGATENDFVPTNYRPIATELCVISDSIEQESEIAAHATTNQHSGFLLEPTKYIIKNGDRGVGLQLLLEVNQPPSIATESPNHWTYRPSVAVTVANCE
jgi:hypothetical protein